VQQNFHTQRDTVSLLKTTLTVIKDVDSMMGKSASEDSFTKRLSALGTVLVSVVRKPQGQVGPVYDAACKVL